MPYNKNKNIISIVSIRFHNISFRHYLNSHAVINVPCCYSAVSRSHSVISDNSLLAGNRQCNLTARH